MAFSMGRLFIPFILLRGALSQCPPLGSVLPAPTQLSTSSIVLETAAEVIAGLQNATSSYNTTAVSIGLSSIHDSKRIIDFHHTPAVANATSTKKVDGDTVYNIGSVSKLFTAFGLLLEGDKIKMTDPITKWVPDLNQVKGSPVNPITTVDWNSITIGALASHLGGIGEDLGDSDIANIPGPHSSLGLPPISAKVKGTECGAAPSQRTCTWTDFIQNFGKREAVYAPFTTPVYSNIGYSLLARAIENASGMTISAYFAGSIFKPLNLSHTSVGTPTSSTNNAIPLGGDWWSTPFGFEYGSGGLYSSINDLQTFGASILSDRLLTPVSTREWLKPTTFTSSTGISVGMAWEIGRATNLTSDGRIIDFYTKGGNIGEYSSIIILVPDYDLVLAMMMAGPDASSGAVYVYVTQIIRAMIPAIDSATHSEASAIYPGTYTDVSTNSSITLAIDSGPGLSVSPNFTIRSIPIIPAYATYFSADPATTTLRLYPTNLRSGNQTSWRASFDTISSAEAVEEDAMLFFSQGSCQTWSTIDIQTYALNALDDFVLTKDDDGGKNVLVEPRAWRVSLGRG